MKCFMMLGYSYISFAEYYGFVSRSNTPKGCNAMYVEDLEDRSNTPKGCNAMLCMSKMSKMHS